MRLGPAGRPIPVGIPYGSRAKLILIYLQTEAIRTQSRELELGRSLRAWLTRLGITVSGPSAAAVRDQAERISRCRLTFQIQKGSATGLVNQNIVDEAIFLDEADEGRQGTLFLTTAKLSEGFFSQLTRHPVPLEEAAIKQLSNNSMALDAYAWLAYRLHSLRRPTLVPWPSLMGQFGGGFGQIKHFKPRFLASVRLALAVYPGARVDEESEGLLLQNSKPPISRKLIAIR
jgi:Plasmid encoded RepA protein